MSSLSRLSGRLGSLAPPRWLSPAWAAFGGSLALSLVAIHGSLLNRDGMLYVDTARVFIDQGFAAAVANYYWPYLSLLMAAVAAISGLSPENSGYLINALFMAGACALLVSCVGHRQPALAWPVCLVILALPGFNEYRDQLLREYGSWFFVMLSFWVALRWEERPRWSLALTVQVSLAMATMFRPEAMVFFPALILWQLLAAPAGERWSRCVMIGGLPTIGMLCLLALYMQGQLGGGRLAFDFGRVSLERFNAKALAMAPALFEYARDQARTILFFGSLAIVPVKYVVKMGVFILPCWYALRVVGARPLLKQNALYAWAFLMHALVLCVFVLDLQFLAGRYVGPLLAFSAPLAAIGLQRFLLAYPRMRWPVVLAGLLVMLGNVFSLAPHKQHYVEAGHWLAANAKESPRVYVESGRAAYYAGWRYKEHAVREREAMKAALARGEYDFVVLEVTRKESGTEAWLQDSGLSEVRRFAHSNGDAVIVAVPTCIPR